LIDQNDIKHEKKKADANHFQTPSLLPMDSPPFESVIIIDYRTDGSNMLFFH
jgi:hypothetical protein